MIRGVLMLCCCILAGPVFALSCIRPDVARSFQSMESSRDVYMIVHGQLDFDPSALPRGDKSGQTQTPARTRLQARLRGVSLGWAGFEHPFDRPVTLIAQCHGPWCANPEAGGMYLAFVKRTQEGFELWTSPCGGRAFPDPGEAQLSVAHQCLRGKRCQPE